MLPAPRHANAGPFSRRALRPALRPAGPRNRVRPSEKKRGDGLERRPPAGIARERETSADDAAACWRESAFSSPSGYGAPSNRIPKIPGLRTDWSSARTSTLTHPTAARVDFHHGNDDQAPPKIGSGKESKSPLSTQNATPDYSRVTICHLRQSRRPARGVPRRGPSPDPGRRWRARLNTLRIDRDGG